MRWPIRPGAARCGGCVTGLARRRRAPWEIRRCCRILRTTLTTLREPVSGGFTSGARCFSTFASDLLSGTATARLDADGEAAYARTRLDTFVSMEAENGVDTDQEMQALLQIEQAYAANAKVIRAVEAMMQSLMEI
jgi:flagellar hook-associated protein 1